MNLILCASAALVIPEKNIGEHIGDEGEADTNKGRYDRKHWTGGRRPGFGRYECTLTNENVKPFAADLPLDRASDSIS